MRRMTNSRVGVGLIGAGMIGQGHAYALRLLAEDGEVRPVAVTDFSARAVDVGPRHLPVRTRRGRRAGGHRRPRRRRGRHRHAHDDTPRPRAAPSSPRASPCCARSRWRRASTSCARCARSVAGVGPHRAGRLPLAFPPAHQRARTARRRATSSARRWATRCATTSTGRPATSFPATARGVRNASTRAAARCSNTRSTAPTSSRGCSVRRTTVYARTRNVFGYDVEDTAVCTIEHDVGRRRHADLDLQRRARARGAPARGVLRARRGRSHDRLPRRRTRGRLPDPTSRPGTRTARRRRVARPSLRRPRASIAATSSCTSTPPPARSCDPSATSTRRRRRSPTRSPRTRSSTPRTAPSRATSPSNVERRRSQTGDSSSSATRRSFRLRHAVSNRPARVGAASAARARRPLGPRRRGRPGLAGSGRSTSPGRPTVRTPFEIAELLQLVHEFRTRGQAQLRASVASSVSRMPSTPTLPQTCMCGNRISPNRPSAAAVATARPELLEQSAIRP